MVTTSTPEPLSVLSDDSALKLPLCVALHGALLRTEIWSEHALSLLRKRPLLMFVLPFYFLGGRSRLKAAVLARSSVDARGLPYRSELVEALRDTKAKGRSLVLTSNLDAELAHGVSEHLGLFDEIVADEAWDHEQQRAALTARFGDAGFDYVGHAAAEAPLLGAARHSVLIGASGSAAASARRFGDKVTVASGRPSRLRAAIKVLRVHQWSKNALVVVPLLLAPGIPSPHKVAAALLAALAFSLCASSGYVFNDLIDIDADRAHRTKHRRPFASGALPAVLGPPLFLALLGASFMIALLALPLSFSGMLGAYFITTMAYSLVLKSKLMLDVVVLAGLYTHRVLSGGIATDTVISAWLLAFSLFMFSSLAFAKRYIELRQTSGKGGQLMHRGYFTEDQAMVASMGPTAGYMAVLLFCLYIQESSTVAVVYHTPALLWFLVPVLLYWISRVWFLAHRGQMQDDPVKFALTDRRSWVCAVLAAVVALAARFYG
ncbi:MAG TPA: UbiA family prenyltransferase [Polyangiaceae bacterium]|nr:UbiA family prenyltransferase [Polyangiaceae bacterium]